MDLEDRIADFESCYVDTVLDEIKENGLQIGSRWTLSEIGRDFVIDGGRGTTYTFTSGGRKTFE